MSDRSEHDHQHEHELTDRMERAVRGLRAPDVLTQAMASGRRQRARRRLTHGAGGLAAAAVVAVVVPVVVGGPPGSGPSRDAGPVRAADPATSASSAAPTSAPTDDCGVPADAWWSMDPQEMAATLADLLPAGVRIAQSVPEADGVWSGELESAGASEYASLTLLPPPGVPGGLRSLQELADGGPCSGGENAPAQPVEGCAGLRHVVYCEQMSDDAGRLVGMVTERKERDVVDGREVATDRVYVLATLVVPGGGHVELRVAEDTLPERGADGSLALTPAQAWDVVSDPVWTR